MGAGSLVASLLPQVLAGGRWQSLGPCMQRPGGGCSQCRYSRVRSVVSSHTVGMVWHQHTVGMVWHQVLLLGSRSLIAVLHPAGQGRMQEKQAGASLQAAPARRMGRRQHAWPQAATWAACQGQQPAAAHTGAAQEHTWRRHSEVHICMHVHRLQRSGRHRQQLLQWCCAGHPSICMQPADDAPCRAHVMSSVLMAAAGVSVLIT